MKLILGLSTFIYRKETSILMFLFVVGCSSQKLEALERGLVPIFYPLAIVRFNNFCLKAGETLGPVYGINRSTKIAKGGNQLLSDFDRDFIPDFIETSSFLTRGFNFRLKDTNGDFFPDGAEFFAGLKANQINPTCNVSADTDTDGDFLEDCVEKHIINARYTIADEDNDGVPDGLEYYFGLDYGDSDDAVLDYDNDGINNAEEIKMGTYIRETNGPNSHATVHLAYQYEVKFLPKNNINDPDCYSFEFRTRFMRQVRNGNLVDFRVGIILDQPSGRTDLYRQSIACIHPDAPDGIVINKDWSDQISCTGN